MVEIPPIEKVVIFGMVESSKDKEARASNIVIQNSRWSADVFFFEHWFWSSLRN